MVTGNLSRLWGYVVLVLLVMLAMVIMGYF